MSEQKEKTYTLEFKKEAVRLVTEQGSTGTFAPFTVKGVFKDTEWRQADKVILPYKEVYP
jgi:hypothetical protein